MNEKEPYIVRYNIVSDYLNNQTEANWKKLEARVIEQLDFETRLSLSRDSDLA